VISQIYGGGGNATAPFLNDFIELHNRGNTAVTLTGWAVQYASSAGTTWTVTPLGSPTVTIAPNGYYLVKEGSGGAVGATLPAADTTGSINMSGTAGKVALTNTITVLAGGCPTGGAVVDFVGFGAAATCFEGAAPTAAPSNSTSVSRVASGCTDANVNSTDFTAGTVNPRNSGSALGICFNAINETNLASESDFCNVQFPTSLVTTAGSPTASVFCQVFEAGVTESAGAPAAGTFTVELGFGPRTTNPESEAGWTWVPMTYNVQAGNNDEYTAQITPPATGTFGYACRVVDVASSAKTFCDLNGAGSNAGLFFETTQLPILTVN
jgi:hypothetical protein